MKRRGIIFFFGQTCMFVCNTEMTTTLGKLFMQQWTTCVQAYFSLTALLLSRRKWSFVSLHFSGLYLPCPISCIIFQIHSIIFVVVLNIFYNAVTCYVREYAIDLSNEAHICALHEFPAICCWEFIHDIVCQMWYI